MGPPMASLNFITLAKLRGPGRLRIACQHPAASLSGFMFSGLLRAAAPFVLLLLSTAAAAQTAPPVAPADLMRHIRMLASDEFQGRAPGTEGERRTIDYIAEQFRARGLEPAGENGNWFQAMRMVERTPVAHNARWVANGRDLPFEATEILLVGRDAGERIADAPVIFAGHGVRMPDRGIDQLAGTDVTGAVVLILLEGPDVPGFPSLADRARTLNEAGAAAVIAVVGADAPWDTVRQMLARGTTRLDIPMARITGALPIAVAQRLIGAAGGNFDRLLNDQPGSSFRAVTLPIRASLEATTTVQRYATNNVVGRLRGSGATHESLLILAHWDHFGTCRPEGEADRICNGAVDNASGVAALIEVAGRLGQGARPVRDVLFLATTSEEVGLIGAGYFAAHPVVPLPSIVAAINLDTVAIHPAGTPVAILGGNPEVNAVIQAAVEASGRRLDTDGEADSFINRQDGFALAQAGVPAVMFGGSFSDMALLNAFLGSRYHQPDDQVDGIVLDGAAEDTTLTAAVARRLADPSVYRRTPPPTP